MITLKENLWIILVVLLAVASVLIAPQQLPTTPKKPAPVPCPPNLLIQEGQRLGVKSLLGKQHPILQKAAEEHAAYQASIGVQGHQLWEQRVQVLMAKLPNCTEFREVANESWPGQDERAAAKEMYKSWRKSPGHWSAVDGGCSYWGYAMALGKNGIWYAAGIFADAR